jgi:hypothetical protein
MANAILKSRDLSLVLFDERHILPFLLTASDETRHEMSEIYDADLAEELTLLIGEPDVFVVEKDGQPLAILGLQYVSNGEGLLWCLFAEGMKDNWVSFIRASRSLINFFHNHYPEISVDTWIGNEKICQWLSWLGFESKFLTEDTNSNKFVHFVRCNSDTKNVYNLSSRPVLH